MLLRHFINRARAAAVLLALLSIAGCAGTGTAKQSESRSDSGRQAASGNLKGGDFGAAESGAAVPAKAQTLYEQAAAALAAGDVVDAELRFKEFLLQYPDYPGAHVNLAIIHAGNGDDEAAAAAIGAALALAPDYPAALNQQGMLLRRSGKFIEAEAAYMKAVTVDPGYALAHYNLGVLNELYLRRLDVALQHFEEYQALVGDDKQVAKWIKDLRRRVAAAEKTANVTN